MNKVALLLHFSVPRWPIVNKVRGIAKCLNIPIVHCATKEKLDLELQVLKAERVLFITDNGLLDFVSELDGKENNFELNTAIFVESKIADVAQICSQIKTVKYLFELSDGDSFGQHLAILIKKFSNKDIMNLDKYLAFGATIRHMKMVSNESKQEILNEISYFIENLGDPGYSHPFGEYAARVAVLTDELLLNSIFNANPRFKNVDRSLPFSLSDQEAIEISWGYDGEYFGVAVRDPFGQLAKNTILERVSQSKNIEVDIGLTPSAGLGLKMIFDQSHQLITNIKREKATEVIAIVKFENRLLDFERNKKFLFYYTD